MKVSIDGKTVELLDTSVIGEGGEAVVYSSGPNHVVKIYKSPDHPDFEFSEGEANSAAIRIAEHQRKLPILTDSYSAQLQLLNGRVVYPDTLAYEPGSNRIIGYRMPTVKDCVQLERLSKASFRRGGTVSNDDVIKIFLDMHSTLSSISHIGMVIGDYNDLNVLVVLKDLAAAYFIDVDSWQFNSFCCKMFTRAFVDPLLCDQDGPAPELISPHNSDSDWFAFTTMLFKSLLLLDPFGGVYRPLNGEQQILQAQRKLRRISVLHDGVGLPSSAISYEVLPDELLDHFVSVFERDRRGPFPRDLIETLRWTSCSNCGIEHARGRCPVCAKAEPSIIEIDRGTVKIQQVFRTSGHILTAKMQDGKLRILYNDGGVFKREDGANVCKGSPKPQMRYGISKDATYIGNGNRVVGFNTTPMQGLFQKNVDVYEGAPSFDANSGSLFYTYANKLYRLDQYGGPLVLGNVLSGRTLFWVGEHLGLAIYRVGDVQSANVFDPDNGNFREATDFSRISGQLIDAECYFSSRRCWFFYTTQEGARTVNHCITLKPDGEIAAMGEAEKGDNSWLGSIRGKVASKAGLFVATDDGLVLVSEDGGSIEVVATFPDTQGLVDSSCRLQPGNAGSIYIIQRNRVGLLTLIKEE